MPRPAPEAVVKQAVAEALRLDPSKVLPDSRLVEDLGAESIDFLDMTFRIERACDLALEDKVLFSRPSGSASLKVEDVVRRLQDILASSGKESPRS